MIKGGTPSSPVRGFIHLLFDEMGDLAYTHGGAFGKLASIMWYAFNRLTVVGAVAGGPNPVAYTHVLRSLLGRLGPGLEGVAGGGDEVSTSQI